LTNQRRGSLCLVGIKLGTTQAQAKKTQIIVDDQQRFEIAFQEGRFIKLTCKQISEETSCSKTPRAITGNEVRTTLKSNK